MRKLIIAFISSTLVFSSCSNDPEDVLPRQSGEWNISGTFTEDTTEPITGSITFSDSNTYQYTWTVGNSTDVQWGTWYATNESVTLVIDEYPTTFNVIESKRNFQKWKHININEGVSVNLELRKN